MCLIAGFHWKLFQSMMAFVVAVVVRKPLKQCEYRGRATSATLLIDVSYQHEFKRKSIVWCKLEVVGNLIKVFNLSGSNRLWCCPHPPLEMVRQDHYFCLHPKRWIPWIPEYADNLNFPQIVWEYKKYQDNTVCRAFDCHFPLIIFSPYCWERKKFKHSIFSKNTPWHQILVILTIYALLWWNVIVRICALFPQIFFLDWKAEFGDIILFWMYVLLVKGVLCFELWW